MTIESVGHPDPLADWDVEKPDQPYYLELFGETSPILETSYARIAPAGTTDASAGSGAADPLYEYCWTIGHPGHAQHTGGFLDSIHRPDNLWEKLADTAARVYLYFPLGGGWRVSELTATVKYMSPVAHEQTFWEKASQDWQAMQPLVEGMSTLASAAGPIGGVAGGVAGQSARILGGLAQLKLESVPQVKGFEWSATKVTFGDKEHGGVMQGIVWTLPKSMFAELGGRLTGSLAVSFLPDREQLGESQEVAKSPPTPQAQYLLAHAVVYGPDDAEHWAPGDRAFIKLLVKPQLAADVNESQPTDAGPSAR